MMKHLKLFFALFAMLALGVGNAWGAEATINFSEKGLENSVQYLDPFTIDANTTITFAGGGNDGKYYNTGTGIRTYGDGTITVECTNGTISEISFTWSGTSYKPAADVATPAGYSTSTDKWTGSASSVTLTRPSGSGHWRLQEVTVTYETAGGGETPDPTPVTVTLNKAELNLQAGATETLIATVTGSTESVTWTSSKITVATVDNTGKVTAVAAGEATITAAIGDVKATCSVTVTAATTPEEPGMGGETTTVTYVFKDDSNCPGNDKTWFNGTIDEFSGWTATKGTNDPKYYTTGTGLRVYNGGTFTITSTKVMTSITLTFAGTSYTFSTSNTTNPQTVTPNAKSYEWSVGRTCRLQKIEITYAADASGDEGGTEEPVASLTVNPTTIDFGTVYEGATVAYQTVAVNFENLNGNVTYSGLSTPFSATGNISTTGDKITISADASTIGEYSQTLTVASTTDSKTAEVTVKMNVVAAPAPTGTFELYSGELTEGDYVIYYNGSAMKAEVASSRLSYVEVAPTDNKIENPDAATIWHIAQSGTNWTIYNNDKGYAAGTGTANKAQLLSQEDITTGASASDNLKKASWTVTGTETYDFVNVFNSTKDSPVNANLRNNVNGGTNYGFACYATNTGGALTLYKKSDGKQAAGLAYATDKYLVKFGDEFTAPELTNPKTLTVTYGSSNEDVATVDATTGAITVKAVGYATITASFGGTEEIREGSAKYTLCVTEHAGTEADPYSVADARRVIDVMETAEGVYATGIVSEIVTAYNATYGNITYNISIDGSTAADQLQAYRGKGVNGENFSSANDIKVGDEVVVKGNLKKHNTIYEFDAENQLVSLKRDKQQAGLAYEEKEHTANVGEDFTEPTLTNPNSLTVTYSSSNTALATVNATTGEVSILAAGKVTITASSAADATYAAGSASYTITITDLSLLIATLPFEFNGKQADIEGTAGMTHSGIDADDYKSAPYLKMNTTGDWLVIHFDSEPEKLSYDIKNNSFSGGKFSVQESADGETYTDVKVHTEITGTQNEEHTLLSTSRYVKFIYTEKSSGNVGLGNIKITEPDNRADAGLAWNPATVSLTVDDAFTTPTLSNPNDLTGITFTSDNEALATVTNAGVISLVSGKTGTATITATYAGDATYKAAEVTCVITVSPKSEKVVILAQYDGQWYAMKAQYVTDKTSHLAPLPVNYVGGKLYNVNEADKALIEWELAVVEGNATFYNDGKYLTGKSGDTDLTLDATACEWTISGDSYLIGARTFLYNAENNWFRNFGTSNAGNKNYSEMPTVTAPVYKTGTLYTIKATAENGTVIGAGIYEAGAEVTLTADPAMDYTFVNWTKGGEVVSTANPFIFEATENLNLVANFQEIAATTKTLSGQFSTGEYEYAEFATGNLQYQPSTDTWRFAKQQYQYVGEANINVGDENYEGWIDMFGWSGDGKFGVNPSNKNEDYYGAFVDWGTKMGEGWSTLSADQWKYLLNTRTNAKDLKQIARVGSVVGIMLFPDVWNAPLTVTAQPDSYFEVDIHNYTLEQWADLEAAGAVFLPAAGRRTGGYGNMINKNQVEETDPANLNGGHYKHQDNTNIYCYYWTSTINESTKDVSFLHNIQALGGDDYTIGTGAVWGEQGRYGQSVRLAKVNTLIQLGDEDNSDVIEANEGKTVNVQVNRSFTANVGYYTICLPFNLAAEKIGTALQISSVTENVAEQGMNVVFTEVTNLVAGQPYLVLPSEDLTNPIFENVEIVNTTGETTATVTGAGVKVTFTGIINGDGKTNGSTEYYVGDKGWLYNGEVDKLGLRAFFTITDAAGQEVKNIRARVVTREDAATGFENITNGENTTIKVIENGQLIIIRNGEKFNAQGQKL